MNYYKNVKSLEVGDRLKRTDTGEYYKIENITKDNDMTSVSDDCLLFHFKGFTASEIVLAFMFDSHERNKIFVFK